VKKCIDCGHDNDDGSLRCVCGRDLPEAAAFALAATPRTEPGAPAPSSTREPRFGLRKLGFVLWALSFVPLFAALRSLLHVPPLYRSLIGTGVFCASAVAALWFLGREKHLALRILRSFFVLRAMFLTPLILTLAVGLAEQGWPTGRHNRPIAHILLLLIGLAVPAFLTGICAMIRTYRLAGVLAIVSGLLSVVSGAFLFRATSRWRHLSIVLEDVLNIVMFGAKVETYISVPIGIVLIVGGTIMLRVSLTRRGQAPSR
jgi:hypothetical protein